ncbi:MAG: hypothetical protein S0880_20545 [Actinomycetota bacterium]|nr:hypothetical protein [Actinomycetota bacterium]
MILVLSVAGAVALVTVASWWMLRTAIGRHRSAPPDPDWGDWPSDQMAP